MMIKVFTTEKDGKIALTAKELKELLDEAYWDGYRANNHSWTYTSPNWNPYYYTTCTDGYTISTNDSTKTNIISDNITSGTVDLNKRYE